MTSKVEFKEQEDINQTVHWYICYHFSSLQSKIQQTKMVATCQKFGDLFLFELVWQYSSVQTKYDKGRG